MEFSYVDTAYVSVIFAFVLSVIVVFTNLVPKRMEKTCMFFAVASSFFVPLGCFQLSINEHRPVAHANSVCRPVLEKALSEYRADFGTDAVVDLSESKTLVQDLAKQQEKGGKKFGPYIYDEQVISACSAHVWRVRPITATTLHVDMAGFEGNIETTDKG